MQTQRKNKITKNTKKGLCDDSNGSRCTNASIKESSQVDSSDEKVTLDIEVITTKTTNFSIGEKSNSNSLDEKDVEMEVENETGFSFDSEMETSFSSVHSKVSKDYSRAIVDNLKKNQTSVNGNVGKHEIQGSHRKQMIVWMEEVLRIFDCPVATFFLSVNIMDKYLSLSKTKLALDELHEIGIV